MKSINAAWRAVPAHRAGGAAGERGATCGRVATVAESHDGSRFWCGLVRGVARGRALSLSLSPAAPGRRAAALALAMAAAMSAAGACGGAPVQGDGEVGRADLVLVGGAIMTMDPQRPQASAVAVRGDRLVAVGSDADVRAWVGTGTRVIDLHGRGVTPGLTDTHAHLSGLGAALESVSLRGAPSAERAAALAGDRKSTRLNSSHSSPSRMPSSA